MKTTVLCYAKCSTCQKAIKWLNDNGIDFIERPIKEENPSVEELTGWINKSGLPIKRFFNTSGLIYKDLSLKDKLPTMTDEEQIELLSTNGMLVKRPLLVTDKGICPGFKEAVWDEILSK